MSNITDREFRQLYEAGEFDADWYARSYPDVAMLGMDAAEHYLSFGKLMGRPGRGETNASIAGIVLPAANFAAEKAAPVVQDIPTAGRRYPDHPFLDPAEKLVDDARFPISNFMYYVWTSRLDLQKAFDLENAKSRMAYCEWFLMHGGSEYGMQGWAYPEALLKTLAGYDGAVGARACELLADDSYGRLQVEGDSLIMRDDGANLIGYARGEFGMGEHVRAVAESLNSVSGNFSIINVPEAGVHGENERRVEDWISDRQDFATNIFHINADVLPSLYFRFGPKFFENCYNVGYWAWELANCPTEFETAMTMMDEVWGISDFVTDSFRQRSQIPVINMPLAVELPPIEGNYSKRYFDIGEDEFVFLFTFDAASYLDRKNPLALIRAFRKAFPKKTEKVRLLLKTMNVPREDAKWKEIAREAAMDKRITFYEKRLKRDEVLGLYLACDAFVSLHRSEGFGRCLTEAMLLGKPVIATGYSGSNDFIRNDTACVVGYDLVPVAEGVYPFWQGQVWADPDEEHAAHHMRRLFEDQVFRSDIARAGKNFIRDNFNNRVIGGRYANRLESIRSMRAIPILGMAALEAGNLAPRPLPTIVAERSSLPPKSIFGSLDYPPERSEGPIYGSGLQISGWVTGGTAVEQITIQCDKGEEVKVHHGFLRPDVASSHIEGVDAGRSGFGHRLDLSGISNGKHRIKVKARTVGGGQLEWTRDVIIGDPADLFRRWKAGQIGLSSLAVSFVVQCGKMSARERKLLKKTLASLDVQGMGVVTVILTSDLDPAACAAGLEIPENVVLTGAERSLSEAITKAKGEFVSVLRAGDVLLPGSLAALAVNAVSNPEADLVYGDEESVYSGGLKSVFKPGWSPLYLREYDYIGHPFFLRRAILRTALGGSGRNVLDEHALLRLISRHLRKVVHVPAVMARTIAVPQKASPAAAPSEPKGGWPGVSVIIPTRFGKLPLVDACFRGMVDGTDYPNLEVVVVANNMSDRDANLEWMRQWPFKIVEWDKAFNWSGLNNLGVRHASHDLLLFLNDDVEPLNSAWLKELVAAVADPHVGIAGALLTYPNGLIQHGGMNLGSSPGETHHTYRLQDPAASDLVSIMNYTREQSLVTGACLLTRRTHFDAIGGFDETMPVVCNDSDFCLRMSDLGLSVVLAGRSRLSHYEGISRAGFSETEDLDAFSRRWKAKFGAADPFLNPNLDMARSDGSVDPDARQSWIGRVFDNPLFEKD